MQNEIFRDISQERITGLNRRAVEMENNPSVCIPYEKVYDMVMARMLEIK